MTRFDRFIDRFVDKRSFFIGAMVLVLYSIMAVAWHKAYGQEVRPDILFIMPDDVSQNMLGGDTVLTPAQMGGIRRITGLTTPNIDSIAANGVSFPAAYGHQMCTPGRTAAYTGRLPDNFGINRNNPILPNTTPTIADVAQAGGYHTGLFGKWHVNVNPNTGNPLNFGFERFYGPLKTEAYYEGDNPNAKVYDQRTIVHNPGYLPEVMATQAINWLHQVDDGKPRLIVYAPISAHEPLDHVTAEQLALVRDVQGSDKLHKLAAVVKQLDIQVGRLLAAMRPNTLVIYTSDNGRDVLNTWRGDKLSLWEGGTRVPMFMQWRGVLATGQTVPYPVSLYDIMPTVAGIVGQPVPPRMQGNNLFEALLPADTLDPTLPRVFNASVDPAANAFAWRAIPFVMIKDQGFGLRYGPWKFYRGYIGKGGDTGTGFKLYNLDNDPGENRNLANSDPTTARTLNDILGQVLAR